MSNSSILGNCFYSGFQTREIVEEWGTNKLGIESVPQVLRRGTLVNIARYRGVTQMQEGEVITPEEIEGAFTSQRVRVEPGEAKTQIHWELPSESQMDAVILS